MTFQMLCDDDRPLRFEAGRREGAALRAQHSENPDLVERLASFDESRCDGSVFAEYHRGRAAGLRGDS